MLNALGWAFAVPSFPAVPDATRAQKQAAAKSVREALQAAKRRQALCTEMMHTQESRRLMINMLMNDPECRKMMKAA